MACFWQSRRCELEEGPRRDLAVGEFDGADAESEGFAAVEREVGRAGEFEAALKFGKVVAGQIDVDELADRDLPEGGDVGVKIGARVGQMKLGSGAVGEEEILLGFHIGA